MIFWCVFVCFCVICVIKGVLLDLLFADGAAVNFLREGGSNLF
jgi:hypothetical protein